MTSLLAAQVVARRRGDDVALVVAPDERVEVGDVLGLVATPEGIAAAERELAPGA